MSESLQDVGWWVHGRMRNWFYLVLPSLIARISARTPGGDTRPTIGGLIRGCMFRFLPNLGRALVLPGQQQRVRLLRLEGGRACSMVVLVLPGPNGRMNQSDWFYLV